MQDTQQENGPLWSARCDALRSNQSYGDLIKIVQAYYDMYDKGAKFLTPWISRQNNSYLPFQIPEKDDFKQIMGKPKSAIHPVMYHNFISESLNFVFKHKGKRTLISPHPTTHHSAQFSVGTFSITKVDNNKIARRATQRKTLFEISFFGSNEPVYVENLQLIPEHVKFIILRPKIGKLGTASVTNWEILFYKSSHSYLINHVDSDLNPRYAGVL